MKYYIIAGEASGDLHGSNLISEIKKIDLVADIRCSGGDKMEAAGGTLVKHYRELAFMGFIEVAKNLGTIMQNFKMFKKDITAFAPDVLILIDYPGFNLRMAKWAKEKGLIVIYYIAPQVWAWKESRVSQIKKYVDKMLVILPFEKAFFAERGYEVDFVGHPLVDIVDDFMADENEMASSAFLPVEHSNIIALLPGSRKQEIEKKLPVMLEVAAAFPTYHFVVAKAPGIDENFYNDMVKPCKNVSAIVGKTYHLLNNAKAALVTSGTATLETALFAVPQIICYKSGNLSYQIAKRLIKVKFIGLVNLILNKEVVQEKIQNRFNSRELTAELHRMLNDKPYRSAMLDNYSKLRKMLHVGSNASANAAKIIYKYLRSATGRSA